MKKLLTTIFLACLTSAVFALPNLLDKKQFDASSVDSIVTNMSSEDIHFMETNSVSDIDIEVYCNYKRFAPDITLSGSSIYIDSKKGNRNFFLDPTGLSCTVVIYVPQKKEFNEIILKASSGDIEIDQTLTAKSTIKIETSSGDIDSSSGLFADSIKLSASSGDIKVYNLDADDFSVLTSSGDITIKKFTGGTGSASATSGEIKAESFACEYAEFKSSSGEITVKKLDCDYFDARNTSGEITLELENAPAATSTAECSSGDIDIYIPMRAKFSVDVSCSSGTFRDKFNNNRMNPRQNYKMDYNGGGSTIKLRTSSGDITLEY